MAIEIKLTPQQIMLILLLVDNAFSAIFSRVAQMTPEEVNSGISLEKERKTANMAELDTH